MPFILAGFKVDKNGARWTGKIFVNLGDLSKASGRKGVVFFVTQAITNGKYLSSLHVAVVFWHLNLF